MAKNKIRVKPRVESSEPQPEPEVLSFFGNTPLPEERLMGREEKKKRGKEEKQRRERRQKRRARFLSVLDGSEFLGERMRGYWGQIFFALFLAILMITSNYHTESVVRETVAIRNELQDLQYRQISSKAELMRLSRQSSVARMLDSTGVKESVVPPYIIRYKVSERPKN